MLITELPLIGAHLIELTPHHDERGFFARSFCKEILLKQGLKFDVIQTNISFNPRKGTLRGLHYQTEPFGEIKIIRCTRGAIFDVIVDIRPNSPTFGKSVNIELTEHNHLSLYVPSGFAHGFQTTTDDAEVLYYMSTTYYGPAARGIRWNDPTLAIAWPTVSDRIISENDQKHPLFGSLTADKE